MSVRVLVVEDDAPLRSLLQLALSRHLSVTVVGSTAQAVLELRDKTFDIVLTDLDLGEGEGESAGRPARDGLWLLGQAREICPTARRLLMSGANMPESDLVHEHVRKPFQPLQLAKRLAG